MVKLFGSTKRLIGGDGYLTGQMLVAMPGLGDARFSKSVVYICAHSKEGAMGLVVNKPVDNLSFGDLLKQLSIRVALPFRRVPVQFGGPVETARGFVLHSVDYHTKDATLKVSSDVALTATVDVLKAIAHGEGPQRAMLALGYAGWGPGQLEGEVHENSWLNCSADDGLVFGEDLPHKWTKAVQKIGVDPAKLSHLHGRA